jgi:hypothetical protein
VRDVRLYREGLALTLASRPEFKLVGEVASLADALNLFASMTTKRGDTAADEVSFAGTGHGEATPVSAT